MLPSSATQSFGYTSDEFHHDTWDECHDALGDRGVVWGRSGWPWDGHGMVREKRALRLVVKAARSWSRLATLEIKSFIDRFGASDILFGDDQPNGDSISNSDHR